MPSVCLARLSSIPFPRVLPAELRIGHSIAGRRDDVGRPWSADADV